MPYGFRQRFHVIQDLRLAGFSDTSGITTTPLELGSRVGKGMTFGFGLDTGSGRAHVKPELRYSHWISPAFDTYLFLRPATNEATFLLGLEFGGSR